MKIIPEKLSVVAKVTKSYGTEGAVALRFSDSEMQTIEGSVFIFFDGFPVPFFIHSSTRKGSGSIVKFDTVNDLSHAEELLGKDRKSTRLNSSHQIISYAVFWLKKKNISLRNQCKMRRGISKSIDNK